MTVQDARQRSEQLIARLQERAQTLTEGQGVLATQLRRALASEPATVAKSALNQAWGRVGAVDFPGYIARAEGYKTQALKAATTRWEAFRATPAGAQVEAARQKVAGFAKRFATVQ